MVTFFPNHSADLFADQPELLPARECGPILLQPAQFYFNQRRSQLTKLIVGQLAIATVLHQLPCASPPPDFAADVHGPRLFLRGQRAQVRQWTLADRVAAATAFLTEGRPLSVVAQEGIDQARQQVDNVVQADHFRMLCLEQTQAFFQVRTMIADDAQRNADLLGQIIQLPLHDLPRRLVDRDQRQCLHVTMLQWPGQLLVSLVANSENHQTLRDAALDGVVSHPNPVVGSFFNASEFVQPQPLQQILDGRVRWSSMQLAVLQLQNQIQTTRRTPQTGGGLENKADRQPHDQQTEGRPAEGLVNQADGRGIAPTSVGGRAVTSLFLSS